MRTAGDGEIGQTTLHHPSLEAHKPTMWDRWGNAIQVLGYQYRVSQQQQWFQEACRKTGNQVNDQPAKAAGGERQGR